ncbi:hypothetical protein F5Y15DRAFT_195298 [Xylariaceae sp. FL0016]|nr:hypothetical protein F5Y15DRAFT_195298 [Xylariaceae sp. FL0016]
MVQKPPKSKPVRASNKPAQKVSSSIAPPPYSQTAPEEPAGLKHQQTLLDIFQAAFSSVLGSRDFAATLQEVKAALYERDFAAAFARQEYLDVYAARWSPTRALCYAKVLEDLSDHLTEMMGADCVESESTESESAGQVTEGETGPDTLAVNLAETQISGEARPAGEEQSTTKQKLRVLAIGGGAAEIVAFASYLRSLSTPSSASASTSPTPSSSAVPAGDLTLLDIGPWDTVVHKLHEALTTPPPLSRYANAALKASNGAFIAPNRLASRFRQRDILASSQSSTEIPALLSPSPDSGPILVTLLFTLNELYTTFGVGATTAFLRQLSRLIPPGSLLLVVDSPGSYSEAAIGGNRKKYPMAWLMDHTLLPPEKRRSQVASESGDEGCSWTKLESHDSLWFRLAQGLRYPIALENMRYQMHLYRANARQVS